MLAGTAPDVAAGDRARSRRRVAVDTKLDGIRIQVHKHGDEVGVFTRSLDDITDRLPEVVEATPVAAGDRPDPRRRGARPSTRRAATAVPGDRRRTTATPTSAPRGHPRRSSSTCCCIDGDYLDRVPGRETARPAGRGGAPRRCACAAWSPTSADEAQEFFAEAVARRAGGGRPEALDAPYDAGRRGSAWVKVKPRHTLDLVVLAVEWGSGRRQGWLSNIHLGARDPDDRAS